MSFFPLLGFQRLLPAAEKISQIGQTEPVGGLGESTPEWWFHGRVPGIGDAPELGFRPGLREIVSGDDRTVHVVTSVAHDRGDVANAIDVAQYPVHFISSPVALVAWEKAAIHEVPVFQARDL